MIKNIATQVYSPTAHNNNSTSTKMGSKRRDVESNANEYDDVLDGLRMHSIKGTEEDIEKDNRKGISLSLSDVEDMNTLSSLSLSHSTSASTSASGSSSASSSSSLSTNATNRHVKKEPQCPSIELLLLESGLIATATIDALSKPSTASTSHSTSAVTITQRTRRDDELGTYSARNLHDRIEEESFYNTRLDYDDEEVGSGIAIGGGRSGEGRRKWQKQLMKNGRVFFTQNIVSDDKIHIGGFQVFDSIYAVRILKFLFLTLGLLGIMHFLLGVTEWENDPSHTIVEFIQAEINSVITDTVSFAVIGRLYKRKGVDRLFPFIIPLTLSCIFASWSTANIWFLQNSISWYNIVHTWPWQLYLFAIVNLSILILVIGLHIKFSIKDGTFVYRSIEAVFILLMFVAPHVSQNEMHLHHWYSFWLFGVLCNREEWWSQLIMALSWGIYINGVSVYGRDSPYSNKV